MKSSNKKIQWIMISLGALLLGVGIFMICYHVFGNDGGKTNNNPKKVSTPNAAPSTNAKKTEKNSEIPKEVVSDQPTAEENKTELKQEEELKTNPEDDKEQKKQDIINAALTQEKENNFMLCVLYMLSGSTDFLDTLNTNYDRLNLQQININMAFRYIQEGEFTMGGTEMILESLKKSLKAYTDKNSACLDSAESFSKIILSELIEIPEIKEMIELRLNPCQMNRSWSELTKLNDKCPISFFKDNLISQTGSFYNIITKEWASAIVNQPDILFITPSENSQYVEQKYIKAVLHLGQALYTLKGMVCEKDGYTGFVRTGLRSTRRIQNNNITEFEKMDLKKISNAEVLLYERFQLNCRAETV